MSNIELASIFLAIHLSQVLGKKMNWIMVFAYFFACLSLVTMGK